MKAQLKMVPPKRPSLKKSSPPAPPPEEEVEPKTRAGHQFNLRMSPEELESLKRVAEAEGRTPSAQIRFWIQLSMGVSVEPGESHLVPARTLARPRTGPVVGRRV